MTPMDETAANPAPALPESGVTWFGFDESTGEFTGEYSTVKPHDTRGMVPFVRALATPAPAPALAPAPVDAGGLVAEVLAACDKLDQTFDPAFTVLWRKAASALAAAVEREAALVREIEALKAEMRAAPEDYPNLLRINREYATRCDNERAAAEARVTAAEAERDAERERCAQIVEDQMPATQDMTSTLICEALERARAAIRKETTA